MPPVRRSRSQEQPMAKIVLNNISLQFRVRQARRITLKEYVVRRLYRQSVNPVIEVNALRDISLNLEDGDRLGIIGHNGAGKSTLLKLMAGIYPPTNGKREVEGSISSLFDIALGFEQDASGWDNIRYRGYLQGETPKTIAKKLPEVAEFSELGKFLDMPVRYYSAGMMIRLAFSIASSIEPEILLIDEVLAAGDLSFQNKAKKRMRELMSQARLMVLISHDLDSISTICSKVAWLDHGRIAGIGPSQQVVNEYRQSVAKAAPAPGAVAA
jgi:ABC-type polysaccharide/polyol phosphate transport system ATPase subunit